MTIPGSYFVSLILLILCLICHGCWANTFKLIGSKWRYELFAYDFAVGVLLAALLGAVTFGSFGLDGFTVMDDLALAGRRQDFFAFLGGSVFGLANILLLGALSLSGMAVAFPVCLGIALVIGTAITYAAPLPASPLLLIAGAVALLAAVVFASAAWTKYSAIKLAAAQAAANTLAAEQAAAQLKPPSKSKSKKSSRKKASAGKGLILAIAAGLVMAGYLPLLSLAREGENGLGPYCTVLIFAVGAAFSTFVCNLFFMNLPIQGAPLEFRQYFSGEPKEHGLGILGGMIWCTGTLAVLVAAYAEGTARVGPGLTYGIQNAAVVVLAAWGLFVWKEFADAEGAIRMLFGVMLLLLIVGVSTVALAPLYGAH